MAPETQLLHANLIRLAKGMVSAVERWSHRAPPSELRQSFLVLVKGMISAWELWTYQAFELPIPKEFQRRCELQEAIKHAHALCRTADTAANRS